MRPGRFAAARRAMGRLQARARAPAGGAAAALLGLAATASAASPAVQGQPAAGFTLRQVLSAPFPSALTASPAAGRLAWVSNAEGVRNVWVAEPQGAHFTSRAVTAYTGDDGYDLGELSWDAAGEQVFYSRGGSLEGGGPVNVMSLASGAPVQTVWAARVGGGAPREIGPGHSPAASPRGEVVAYISAGQIWMAPAAGGAPSQLIHDRGRSGSPTWSPDGSRLAFVSTRQDHSLVGVYDVATRLIAWMAPSVDTDLAPEWSPDGRRLAFVRTPAGAGGPFLERRQGEPWSIWVGDPATGEAKRAWRAEPGRGSVLHGLESERVLMWGADDRLVFPWERTGWTHLWALPLLGGPVRDLTPGEGELFNAALAPDRRRVVYSADTGDIDRRHLWEADLAGGPPRLLTPGAGIEDAPALTSDGRLAALHATARDPLRTVVVASGAVARRSHRPRCQPTSPRATWSSRRRSSSARPTASPSTASCSCRRLASGGGGPALLFFHGGPRAADACSDGTRWTPTASCTA